MGKKIFKLSGQGQTVKGALAFYLAPKMAEDQRLKPGELDSLVKSITPTRYERQIDGIVGTVKERFGSRLAQDEKLDDLHDLLAVLLPSETEIAQDKACAKDEEGDDNANDEMESNDSAPHKLKEELSAEDEDEDAGSLVAMAKELMRRYKAKAKAAGTAADKSNDDPSDEEDDEKSSDDDDDADDRHDGDNGEEDDEAEDAPKGKDKKMSKDNVIIASQYKKGKKESEDKKLASPFGKPSMDEAFKSMRALAAKDAVADLQARYKAQEAVLPYVGKIDVLACDSVPAIFKLALDAAEVDTTGVPESAFAAMVKMLPTKLAERNRPANFAMDSKSEDAIRQEFPNAPKLA